MLAARASPTRDLHRSRAPADTADVTEPQQQAVSSGRVDQAAPPSAADDVGTGAGFVLQISTSPRSTWLWAPDEATVGRVREVLGGWSPVQHRGEVLALVMDIDIGVIAYETCEKLAEAGFTFSWHESVHPLDRLCNWPSELPGMPGQGGTA